jgi:hypothetical protein
MNGLFVYSQTVAVKDVYEFPIKPESKEWIQFESIEGRIAALQIPDAVLIKMSTEGLLETCLKFPYLIDIFFFNSYQQGFEALTDEFNGFRELLKRRDLTNALLKKYRSLSADAASLRLRESVEQGMFTFRHFVLEYMLTQDVVFKTLSPEQEKQLFLLSFEHKKMKSNYSDVFSNLNDIPTNLLYVKKAMSDADFKFKSAEQKKALSDFIQNPRLIDPRIMDNVEDFITVKFK